MNELTSYPKAANLTEQVYLTVKRAIIAGEYDSGDSLTELSLAQTLNVSRTPVREALRLLEQENLVEIRPNRGAVVVGVSMEDIRDIYSIRSELEGVAAQRAAERATDAEIAQLGEYVDLMEFYLEKQNPDKMLETDDSFHRRLYELSGSRMLGLVLSEMHVYASRVRKASMQRNGRGEHTVAEHRAIYEAIRDRDSERARECAFRHIAQTTENISQLFEEKKKGE